MFWTNIKAIFENLPLVLSETYEPKDVSLNRLAFLLLLFCVLCSPVIVLVLLPQHGTAFLPYWQGLATLLGGQTFANLGRKAVNAYLEKGSDTNGTKISNP